MNTRTAIAAALTATALLAASACGSSGDKTTSADTTSGASSSGASNAALHNQLPESVKSSGVINFALQQHPPFEVVQGQTYSGPGVDLANALADVLGVKAKNILVGGGLAPVLSGLLSHRYDAALGPVEAAPEREQQFDLVSWLTNKSSYVVDKAKTRSDIMNLCGQTVAIVSDSTTANDVSHLSDYCVKNNKGAVSQLPLSDTNATILAVKTGRAAGAGTTLASALAAIKADPSLGTITQTKEEGGLENNSCIIMPKSLGMGSLMEKAFQVLFKNGTYQKVMKKYGLTELAVKAPQLNPPLDYTE